MVLATVDVLVQPALLDRAPRIPGRVCKLLLIAPKIIEVRALDSRRRAAETAIDDLVIQPTISNNCAPR